MKVKIAILSAALVFLMATACCKVEAAAPPPQPPVQPIVYETVSITVWCQTANLTVTCAVTSNVTGLVHFPAGIDMNSDQWVNVTSVSVAFSESLCFLDFCFEDVDEKTARSIADSLKVNFEKAFNTTYTYNSTHVNSVIEVIYMGLGVANLTQCTQELIEECLAQDLGGYSKTFIPMVSEPTAITILSATKSAGGFDWEYSMIVTYFKSIPTGTGVHTIDVLELLHVEELEPSPYSDLNVTGGTVLIYGYVQFVDCKPNQVQNPGERGWCILPSVGDVLAAAFSFGNETTPFTELWLKFNGEVIPEFTTLTWTTALMLVSIIVVALKKRFSR